MACESFDPAGAAPPPAQALELLCAKLGIDAASACEQAQRVMDTLADAALARSYRDLPPAFFKAAQHWAQSLAPNAANQATDLLLLASSVRLDDRFAASGLPEVVRPEFRKSIDRIVLRSLAEPARPLALDSDIFLKDLAILRLVLIPCVSHLILRNSGVPRRIFTMQSPARWPRLLRHFGVGTGGLSPFMENHVHTDMLQDFHAAGRERCYRLLGHLLAHWSDSKGLIGSSWYYDARVGEISPHLAYLRTVPERHGAVFLRAGSDADVVRSATSTSSTRRRLYEQGAYRPERYLMSWARRDILAAYGP